MKDISGSLLANEQFLGLAKADGWLPLSRIELVELRLMKIKPIIHIAGSVTKQETKQIGWINLKWNFQAIFLGWLNKTVGLSYTVWCI